MDEITYVDSRIKKAPMTKGKSDIAVLTFADHICAGLFEMYLGVDPVALE